MFDIIIIKCWRKRYLKQAFSDKPNEKKNNSKKKLLRSHMCELGIR